MLPCQTLSLCVKRCRHNIRQPPKQGTAGASPPFSGAYLTPGNTPFLHACYHAEFGRSRSNGARVMKEIPLKILTPRIPPFKITQGHRNRHESENTYNTDLWKASCLFREFPVSARRCVSSCRRSRGPSFAPLPLRCRSTCWRWDRPAACDTPAAPMSRSRFSSATADGHPGSRSCTTHIHWSQANPIVESNQRQYTMQYSGR